MKYLIIIMLLFCSCSTADKNLDTYYQPKLAIGGVGVFEKINVDPSVELKAKGVKQLSLGLSIVVVSFIISLMFANGITHKISDYGVAGGGVWSLNGLLKIFIGMYLTYIIWGVVLCVIGFLIFRFRKKSIVNIFKKRKLLCTSLKKVVK